MFHKIQNYNTCNHVEPSVLKQLKTEFEQAWENGDIALPSEYIHFHYNIDSEWHVFSSQSTHGVEQDQHRLVISAHIQSSQREQAVCLDHSNGVICSWTEIDNFHGSPFEIASHINSLIDMGACDLDYLPAYYQHLSKNKQAFEEYNQIADKNQKIDISEIQSALENIEQLNNLLNHRVALR